MLSLIKRLFHYRRMARQIRTERPALRRLTGAVLLQRYIDVCIIDYQEQDLRFEASLLNPNQYGGYIQFPAPASALLVEVFLYLNPEADLAALRPRDPSRNQLPFPERMDWEANPLAWTVMELNWLEGELADLYRKAERKGKIRQDKEAFLLTKIGECRQEVARLTRQRREQSN